MTQKRNRLLSGAALGLGGLALVMAVQRGPEISSAQTQVRGPVSDELRTAVGLDRAEARWEEAMPTGRGIPMGHVEGDAGHYAPRGPFSGVVVRLRSGASEPFDHAQMTARLIYGRFGLAPGVAQVDSYAAADWMAGGYLGSGTGQRPSADEPVRLWTHSWIASGGRGTAEVLRRLDYQIDERGVVCVAAVNNGRGRPVPALLGSAYNALVIGSDSGNSSGGYTQVEVAGRVKPDLVAPGGLTSVTTAVAAGLVARLMEWADRHPEATGSARPEVIKAALLAGAEKPAGWAPEEGRSLDAILGAGRVRLDQAMRVLEPGPTPPGPMRQRAGWDYRAIERSQKQVYRLDLRESMAPASFVLTWHRRVGDRLVQVPETDGQPPRQLWAPLPRFCNLDLRLERWTEAGEREEIALSASTVDNVEHVYVPSLEPGRYRLVVSRGADGYDESWNYALAWCFGE